MPRSVVRLSAGRLNFSRSDQVQILCQCIQEFIKLFQPYAFTSPYPYPLFQSAPWFRHTVHVSGERDAHLTGL